MHISSKPSLSIYPFIIIQMCLAHGPQLWRASMVWGLRLFLLSVKKLLCDAQESKGYETTLPSVLKVGFGKFEGYGFC